IVTRRVGEIAPGRAEREHGRAGQEMVGRRFLERNDAKPRRTPPGRQNDLAVLRGANEAQTALALMQLALPRTKIAPHASVGELRPVARRDDVTGKGIDNIHEAILPEAHRALSSTKSARATPTVPLQRPATMPRSL